MTSPKTWLPWIAVAVAATLAGLVVGSWWAHTARGPAVQTPVLQAGTWLPSPRTIEIPSLIDSASAPFGRANLTGHASLVYFGFTHCPDMCPATLAMLAQLLRDSPIDNLNVYLVTVDPERDSPEALRAYTGAFDPQFIGLTGAPQDLSTFMRQLGGAAGRVELPGGEYLMDHTGALFLLDDRAQLRAIFTPPFSPAALATDLPVAMAASRG